MSDGQALYLGDDRFRLIALPFSVAFYGRNYAGAWVSDNGYVTFSQPSTESLPPPAGCVRTAAEPNSALYVLAADWKPGLGGQVYTHMADADTFVVTWQGVLAVQGAPHSFQLVFHRNGGIWANYRAVAAPVPGIIGAENSDGTIGQMVTCGTTGRPVTAGDVVRFEPVLPW